MSMCHYIESYRDKVHGRRVSLWQRDHYMYELATGATHIRWFNDMSLDEVRDELKANHYEVEVPA